MSINLSHVLKILFLSLTSLFLLSACSSVTFEDPKTGEEVGFEYFPPKPYLVISENEKGERSVALISLPDVSSPRQVKHEGGWGTLEFNFTVSNGMIVAFGQKVDSKGPETIDAVSGGLTSIVSSLGLGVGAMAAAKVTLTNEAVEKLAGDLKFQVIDPLSMDQNPALQKVANALRKTWGKLLSAANIEITGDKELLDVIESNRKELAALLKELEENFDILTIFADNPKNINPSLEVAREARYHLGKIIKGLKPFTVAPPENLQIYEIVPKGDGEIGFEPVILS